METEDEAQARINRHHEEVARRKREKPHAEYLERVRVYSEARAAGKWPVDFQPNSG